MQREVRATLRLAGPVVAAQLAQISMGFVDTVMVGRLGPEALAGVGLGNAVFFTLLIVCISVVQAVNPMVSQAHGAGEDEPVERSVRQGLWLGVMLAAPAMTLLWNAEALLRLAGQAPDTAARAGAYLRAIQWAFLPACWFMALRSFVEGLSRPLPVTIITALGVGLNVAANYGLMFGAWGLPALGLVGTGWASTIVYWFLFGALAVFVLRVRPFAEYRVFSRLRVPDPEYLRELVRIGGPMGVSRGIEAGLFSVTALVVGTFGTTALAAHQIAIQCAAFTFMVPVGIATAASVRVGQAAGRDDRRGARRAGQAAIGLAGAFMGVTALAFWLVPERIVALFLDTGASAAPDNAAVAALAAGLLGIAALFQVVDGLQVAASGALQGLKDTRVPMVIALATYWGVGLSSGLALGLCGDWGARGLWWGLVLGLTAAAVLLLARFHRHVERAVDTTTAHAKEGGEREG
jgi:MATE family multidrug resistance protein